MGFVDYRSVKFDVFRFGIKEIRDTDWFKRKHPMIREELAPLPADTLDNETSTFRMLNYLDKYCRPASACSQPEAAHRMITSELSEANIHGHVMAGISHGGLQLTVEPSATQPAPVSAQNSEVSAPPSGAKKYGQTSKVKRNHCNLM